MRYGTCIKCGKSSWLQKHHVYPRSQFNDEENTMYLCPNCHTDLHLKMGSPDAKDKGFYQSFHISWIMGIIVVIVILSLIHKYI
jgi:hypothetical protein